MYHCRHCNIDIEQPALIYIDGNKTITICPKCMYTVREENHEENRNCNQTNQGQEENPVRV